MERSCPFFLPSHRLEQRERMEDEETHAWTRLQSAESREDVSFELAIYIQSFLLRAGDELLSAIAGDSPSGSYYPSKFDLIRMQRLTCIIQVSSECYTATNTTQARHRLHGPFNVSNMSACAKSCSCAGGLTRFAI